VVTTNSATSLLSIEDAELVFPNGTKALRGVNLEVDAGMIRGLVGANGAGKSTLVKIMSGVIKPSKGRVTWRGREVHWHSPDDSMRSGVATVYQNTPLVPTFTVLENVFLGTRDGWRWKPHDKKKMLNALCSKVGFEVDQNQLASQLSVGEKQMVSLLQALSRRPSLLILDEPSASLSQSEREALYASVRRIVKEDGTAVVYVSHFLDEVLSMTDAVTVLRDGRVTLSRATEGLSGDELVSSILGKELAAEERSAPREVKDSDAEAVLEVTAMESPGKIHDITFKVMPGEVVGIAGLLGSGRSEILHGIYGSDPSARGSIKVQGKSVRRSPTASVKAGLALVPEDRGAQGLVPGWEIWRNVTLPFIASYSRFGLLLSKRAEEKQAEKFVQQLSILTSSVDTKVDQLSGGNAQKVVLAKWFDQSVRVVLLDEPTAGVDVGAKRDIQEVIRVMAGEGRGVVVVDSEFHELLHVADRVIVVHRGRIIDERQSSETTADELMRLASGL
jgi:ribose transport system ATP-binding protein